jgi:glycosyltransferase involved in cell wall biosynthesis
VLVDPEDASSIAQGIAAAEANRVSLVTRGEERARAFSWPAVADATVAVYREALA